MDRRFIAYYRVSTQQQGRSGLGLEAQRAAVAAYVARGGWEQVGAFEEVETGKGANALARRPQLQAALTLCKKQGATLIIAKLDRLARNVHFVTGLLEAGVEFVAADMPTANKVMIQVHAVMCEWERDQISARTRAALAAAKARGVQLGKTGPANLRANNDRRVAEATEVAMRLRPVLASFAAQRYSQRRIVGELNALGVPAARGGRWSLTQLRRVLRRLA